MAKASEHNPVIDFVKVLYGKQARKKRLRASGERALAREGIRVIFEDELPEQAGDERSTENG